MENYAAICLEGCIIVVWNYVGELIFNMLVLEGCIKMRDQLIRKLMGLG